MRIDDYQFGKMTVDGKEYNNDLIISDDEIIDSNWWREETGHHLMKKHLDQITSYSKKGNLIIGQGASGRMTVPNEIVSYLENKGFDVTVARSADAAEKFNKASSPKIGAFHLTC